MKFEIFFPACVIALSLCACEKKKDKVEEIPEPVTTDLRPGFPDNKTGVNGYLYASKETSSGNNNFYNYFYFAAFNDPAANLLKLWDHANSNRIFDFSQNAPGNVGVGDLSFGGNLLLKNNNGINLVYNSAFQNSTDDGSLTWHSDGNQSFKPLNQKIDRNFPYIATASTNSLGISLSNGFTVNLTNLMLNYDSAMITISSGSKIIKKSVALGTPVISFSGPEFQGLSAGWSANIAFQAFNYSTRTIADKVYLFELAYKYRTYVIINP